MSQRKHIQVFCHGNLGVSQTAKSPWEDCWLRWKGKPGRKVYHASPCLMSVAEVHHDLQMHAEIRATHNEPEWYLDEDADGRALLDMLQVEPYACRGTGARLMIVTPANGFDRAEAERMMSWWLDWEHHIRNVKFVWNKPEIIVQPTGFGYYA